MINPGDIVLSTKSLNWRSECPYYMTLLRIKSVSLTRGVGYYFEPVFPNPNFDYVNPPITDEGRFIKLKDSGLKLLEVLYAV